VALERGQDPRTFFVPLVGFTTNDPLLLEVRYTMPGSEKNLRYPIFPDDPAMQRVNLVAYIPQERDLISHRGPWSPEMTWTTGVLWERRYIPDQDVSRLVANLHAGIDVMGNPAVDFPVDGKPLLFTTLRPKDPDDGALRLTTVRRKILDAVVLVGFLTLGVSLLSQSYVTRFAFCSALLGCLILMGVFMPLLAGHVFDQTLIVAFVLVGLLWCVVSVMRAIPKLAHITWMPSLAGATTASSVETAGEAAPVKPPPSGEESGEETGEGGEHHG
jgi:hypothetical protein